MSTRHCQLDSPNRRAYVTDCVDYRVPDGAARRARPPVSFAEPLVSLVLPVYNERESLAPVLDELAGALDGCDYEVIAVDDASTDGSLEELRRLRDATPTLRVLTLTPHAGQSAALVAGFDAARGQVVVTMDADGQYDPRDALRLMAALIAADGCDAIVGYRERRADNRWKRLQSAIANRCRDRITGDRVRDTGCSLRAIRRDVLQRLPRFRGMHRFLPTLIRHAGGRVEELAVSHRARAHGRSHYGMVNRFMAPLRDALGVRWLRQRALRYTCHEASS